MTILHIGFYTWQDISQQNDLKIIEEINFVYSLIRAIITNHTEIDSLLEGTYSILLVFLGLVIFVWSFVANMIFQTKAELKKKV